MIQLYGIRIIIVIAIKRIRIKITQNHSFNFGRLLIMRHTGSLSFSINAGVKVVVCVEVVGVVGGLLGNQKPFLSV